MMFLRVFRWSCQKNGGGDEEYTGGRVRKSSVCMCVVLRENEKEKNKNESDRPKREKRELWDMWWGRTG